MTSAPEGGADVAHYVLLATWLSPAFPVGSFSYSHGLETVITSGVVGDGDSLREWVGVLLAHGSGWCDAALLAEAVRAVEGGDDARLRRVAELAEALAPSAERHAETMTLGATFLAAVEAGWPTQSLSRGRVVVDRRAAYPIAVGLAAAAHRLPLAATLAAFLNGFAASLISVAVRLVPLGQTAGLRVLADLHPLVLATADRAAASTLDDLGSAAILSDIAAMRHETLYSRIFRS